MAYRSAIVTPVKNEDQSFGGMVSSVVNQTVLPGRWIIVDDGSTDRTGDIIRQAAASHDWISAYRAEIAGREENLWARRY